MMRITAAWGIALLVATRCFNSAAAIFPWPSVDVAAKMTPAERAGLLRPVPPPSAAGSSAGRALVPGSPAAVLVPNPASAAPAAAAQPSKTVSQLGGTHPVKVPRPGAHDIRRALGEGIALAGMYGGEWCQQLLDASVLPTVRAISSHWLFVSCL